MTICWKCKKEGHWGRGRDLCPECFEKKRKEFKENNWGRMNNYG